MEHAPAAYERRPGRRRRPVAVALVAVIAAGLTLQLVRHLPGSDVAGTAAYAVAAVLAVALVRPGWSARMTTAVGTGAACAVELAQLTTLPGAISGLVPGARLLLGANFDPVDLGTLAVVGAFAGVLLAYLERSRVAVPGAASPTR